MTLKRAALINTASKYAVIIMNIGFTAILARILTPDDYGIIAVLTIFTTLFSRISDMGFGTAVIQFHDLQKSDVDDIFSFTGFIAIGLALLFALLGFPIAAFYSNEVYRPLCILLAVSVYFNCLNMVPNSVLLRDKKFLIVAIRTVIVNMIGYVFAIVCALIGWKYYSLAIQSVVASVLNYVWNNHTARLKLSFHIHFNPIKRVWNYGIFQFAFSWINYFEGNLDSILIGGVMGSRSLAYYDKGYKLTGYPLSSIAGIITPVLHPILKDYQNDKKYLFRRYMEIQQILSVIALPIVPVLLCAGKEIIAIIYGNQWENTVVAFQILCLSVYPRMMMSTTGSVYCSASNTKMLFVAGFINAAVTCAGITAGVWFGSIEAVAIGVAIASWSNMIVTFSILIGRVLGESVLNYFGQFFKDITVMFITCVIVYCFGINVRLSNVFLSLFAKMCIVIMIYIGYLMLSGKLELLKKMIKKN